MTSFRRVAFPLGFVAICGGALLFSLSTANGQSTPPSAPSVPPVSPLPLSGSPGSGGPGMSGAPGAPGSTGAVPGTSTTATTGTPPLKQTIGVSPVQVGKKQFIVLGGTGNETYDLQIENLYSLLRENGVPIPNILHPLSTAKPSFIIERLITLNKSGGTAAAGGTSSPSAPSLSGSGPSSAQSSASAGGTAVDTRLQDVAITFTALHRIVQTELKQGTGRLGGGHRQKLLYLSQALGKLETQARAVIEVSTLTQSAAQSTNQASSKAGEAIGHAQAAFQPGTTVGETINEANKAMSAADQAKQAAQDAALAKAQANATAEAQLRLEGEARLLARAADRYTPNNP